MEWSSHIWTNYFKKSFVKPFSKVKIQKVYTLSHLFENMTSAMDIDVSTSGGDGIRSYYEGKINELEVIVGEKERNLVRLEAQRNELNSKVRKLREELSLLHEPGSYIGEVIKVMSRKKVLVKVGPEGKYVVDIAKDIDIA